MLSMVSPNQHPAPYTPELPFGEDLSGIQAFISNSPETLAAYQRGLDRAKQDLEHPELQKLPNPVLPEHSNPVVPQHIINQTAELYARNPDASKPRPLSQRGQIDAINRERYGGTKNGD